jgi:hypothetical protein
MIDERALLILCSSCTACSRRIATRLLTTSTGTECKVLCFAETEH